MAQLVCVCLFNNDLEQSKAQRNGSNAKVCRICGDEIAPRDNGQVFVACHDCGFPVCQPCYEYERREGNQTCPQCNSRYKRHRGTCYTYWIVSIDT